MDRQMLPLQEHYPCCKVLASFNEAGALFTELTNPSCSCLDLPLRTLAMTVHHWQKQWLPLCTDLPHSHGPGRQALRPSLWRDDAWAAYLQGVAACASMSCGQTGLCVQGEKQRRQHAPDYPRA